MKYFAFDDLPFAYVIDHRIIFLFKNSTVTKQHDVNNMEAIWKKEKSNVCINMCACMRACVLTACITCCVLWHTIRRTHICVAGNKSMWIILLGFFFVLLLLLPSSSFSSLLLTTFYTIVFEKQWHKRSYLHFLSVCNIKRW